MILYYKHNYADGGSWADMVECLHQAQLNYLASIIEEMYEHGRCEFNIIIIVKYTHHLIQEKFMCLHYYVCDTV